MRTMVLLIVCLTLPACAAHQAPPSANDVSQDGANDVPMLITRADQLDGAIGKLVIIQGEVTNSKIPTILGVDVASDQPDLRGQQAQARGILRKSTVTQQQHDEAWAKYGPFPSRGPGTFYRLLQVGSDSITAPVQPLP